jgi:hypothetical protein
MKSIALLGIVLATGLWASPASAGLINATATYTDSALAGGQFAYTITLTDNSSSTDPIGTFWFAWTPGKDFMTNNPISEITPTGWVANITHGGATDGYAIQWVASSNLLTPGTSLTFGFTSLETPTQLAGFSQFFPTIKEATATLYNAAPFSADSETIVATQFSSVPEPSSLMLTLVGGLGVILHKRIARLVRA